MQVQPAEVGDVVPSPRRQVGEAYTQSRAVMETEKSEVNTQIFLASSDGSHRMQLTRGEKSATRAAVFASDGRATSTSHRNAAASRTCGVFQWMAAKPRC